MINSVDATIPVQLSGMDRTIRANISVDQYGVIDIRIDNYESSQLLIGLLRRDELVDLELVYKTAKPTEKE